MRWPWRGHHAATDEAQEHIDRLRAQQPEVNRINRELRAAREHNHFAEMVLEAMRAGRRAAPDR